MLQDILAFPCIWTSSRWSSVKQKKSSVFCIRRERVHSLRRPLCQLMSKESGSHLSHSELVWLERETIKTCKDIAHIIVYNNDVEDFDIEMRNGHRFIFYCVWLEKEKKDLLVGCLIKLAFPFSTARTAFINASIDFDPHICAQVSLGGKHPYINKIKFQLAVQWTWTSSSISQKHWLKESVLKVSVWC